MGGISDVIIELAERLEREFGFSFDDAVKIIMTYPFDLKKAESEEIK